MTKTLDHSNQRAFARTATTLRLVAWLEKIPGCGIATNTSEEINVKKMVEERVIKNKNGKWKEFNKRGELVSEGNYVNDLKHGMWREYYETGQVLIEECYDHGIPHGKYAAYHPNGQLFSEGQYQKGKREGTFNVYDEDGRLLSTMMFICDQQIEENDWKTHA